MLASYPPSSFPHGSSPSPSADSIPSTSSRERSGSEATIATIYSMYGASRTSKSTSYTPPQDDVPQVSSLNLEQLDVYPRRDSVQSAESSELPYVISETYSSSDAKPPRPPRALHPVIRPSTAPSLHIEQDGLTDDKKPSHDRRSLSLSHNDSLSSNPEVIRTPLQVEKPIPPTPPDSSLLPSDVPSNVPTSLEPTYHEDSDSYFIRNTYAQLDIVGVPGDGYEDGIERTRARLNAATEPVNIKSRPKTISPAELQVLQNLDRYGFYTRSSGDRRVLLAKIKPLALYKQTQSFMAPSPPPLNETPSLTSSLKEYSRISKWERMIVPRSRNEGTWTINPRKEHKLRERVYKGIPDRWRGAAWDVLLSRKGEKSRHGRYTDLLDLPSEYDIQIDLDVPRTITGHVMFRTRYGQGQRSLFHVLHCFSLHCGECGYCQGMGPLAAAFLCYVEPEKAHSWLCQLHMNYSMHAIYRPGFPGLLENIYVQERIMERFMPGVYTAFKKHMISTTAYATKWYITLFANSVPFQTQLRLWDAFFLEGLDVIVIMAVAVVWSFRDYLISHTASFETMLSLLSSFFVPPSEDDLMDWIYRVMSDKGLRADMTSWRNEWTGLVERGQDMSALL